MNEDGSFDSSGGVFPDGYCIWALHFDSSPSAISCHCRTGHECGSGPLGVEPEYEGQLVKWPCGPAGGLV